MDAERVIQSWPARTGPPEEVGGAGRREGSGLKHSLTLSITDMCLNILQLVSLNLKIMYVDTTAIEISQQLLHVAIHLHLP